MDIFIAYQQLTQQPFWIYEILGNSVGTFIVAGAALIGYLVLFKVFQMIILARLRRFAEKTATDLDDTLIQIVQSLRPPFYSFIAFYFAVQILTLNDTFDTVMSTLLIIWVVYQVIHAVQILLDYVIRKTLKARGDDGGAEAALGLVSRIVTWALWVIGILMILSNLGINVTSLVAGLGIGGLAFALAAQNILSDLFSSFSIVFDKPFQIGDFIVVESVSGTVLKIGIKTTRLKSLDGEEIVISNNKLTSANVQNYGKLEERRVLFSVGVTYETPSEKLQKVPTMIQEIIDAQDGARFDRAHFKTFGDSALAFEVVFYAETSDYAKYMDMREAVNFGIRDAFEKEGIDMAYPTQTIHMVK